MGRGKFTVDGRKEQSDVGRGSGKKGIHWGMGGGVGEMRRRAVVILYWII